MELLVEALPALTPSPGEVAWGMDLTKHVYKESRKYKKKDGSTKVYEYFSVKVRVRGKLHHVGTYNSLEKAISERDKFIFSQKINDNNQGKEILDLFEDAEIEYEDRHHLN